MKYTSFCLMSLSLLLSTSCGKEAVDLNKEYIGHWVGWCAHYTYCIIDVNPDSRGSYVASRLDGAHGDAAGTARIKNGYLRIGIKKMKIVSEPKQLNINSKSFYQMTLKIDDSDIVLTRE